MPNLKIAIVGDCHGLWSDADIQILSVVKPDFVLFVGDISEGRIKIIKEINRLDIPSYVILGNHDRGSDKTGETLLKQIKVLQEKFCGWKLKIFKNKINIVGGRPCSSGGGYFLAKEVLGIYGPLTEEQSARKIINCAIEACDDLPLIILAHAGPTGLGSESNSICGRDWKIPPLDWGDRDLNIALKEIKKNRKVDLVVFGHMHNTLNRNQGTRKMLKIDNEGTFYLNAAIVPRYKKDTKGNTLVNFSWVEFSDNKLIYIGQRWYSIYGQLVKEEKLFNL